MYKNKNKNVPKCSIQLIRGQVTLDLSKFTTLTSSKSFLLGKLLGNLSERANDLKIERGTRLPGNLGTICRS